MRRNAFLSSESNPMSATPFNDFQNGVSSRHLTDEKMEQVRELLFGDYERQAEARITVLESRIQNLELSLHGRLDALQARLDAISAEMEATQRQTLDQIGAGLQELGARLKQASGE